MQRCKKFSLKKKRNGENVYFCSVKNDISSIKSRGSRIVAIATDCKSVRESVRWFESTLPHNQQTALGSLFLCLAMAKHKREEFF